MAQSTLSPPIDDDDELIAEIDIYHSQPPPHRELFVLDYPSRAFGGPSIGRDRAAEQIRLRPKHGRVEVTLSSYPRTSDVQGHSDKSFQYDRVVGHDRWSSDSQTFLSCPSTPPPANFSAGMYFGPDGIGGGNGCLVLVPVAKIARMRPSFAYLDEVDANRLLDKAMQKAGRDQERGDLAAAVAEETGDGKEVEVEMTFTKRESERTAERRKASFAHITKIEEMEKWVTLDFLDHTHGDVPASRDSIFRQGTDSVEENGVAGAGAVAKTEDAIMTDDAPAADAPMADAGGEDVTEAAAPDSGPKESYIDRLYRHAPSVNPLNEPSRRLTQMGHRFDSMRALHTARPESAIEKLLSHARVISFGVLRSCVSSDISDDDLITHARKTGFLLRGCWVRDSPKGNWRTMAPGNRPAPRIPAARLLILDLFRLSPVVSVADVMEIAMKDVVPPTDDFVKEVLNEVGDFKKSIGWVFRWPQDERFINDFPDIVRAEDEAWEKRLEDARTTMKTGGRSSGRGAGGSKPTASGKRSSGAGGGSSRR